MESMKFTNLLTDDTVLSVLGDRLARIRLRKNQSQAVLAKEAGISKRTLERLEAGQSVQLTSLIRVLRALDLLTRLEAVLPPLEPSPRELVELRGKERQRASKSSTDDQPSGTEWTWGTTD